jgi:hypothetical protein
MYGPKEQAKGLVMARLHGTISRRVSFRPLTGEEQPAAVSDLLEIIRESGRDDGVHAENLIRAGQAASRTHGECHRARTLAPLLERVRKQRRIYIALPAKSQLRVRSRVFEPTGQIQTRDLPQPADRSKLQLSRSAPNFEAVQASEKPQFTV